MKALLVGLLFPTTLSATTGSYTGTWRVTLTHYEYVTTNGYMRGPDETHCLVLTDDGAVGWPHSGFVQADTNFSGSFTVIGHTMLIAINMTGSGDEPASWVFAANASGGMIAVHGAFGYVQGG